MIPFIVDQGTWSHLHLLLSGNLLSRIITVFRCHRATRHIMAIQEHSKHVKNKVCICPEAVSVIQYLSFAKNMFSFGDQTRGYDFSQVSLCFTDWAVHVRIRLCHCVRLGIISRISKKYDQKVIVFDKKWQMTDVL